MSRPKLFKALRITWSMACGVVAVLLCVLWVRSYWVAETISRGSRTTSSAAVNAIVSNYGTLILGRVTAPPAKRLPLEYTNGWAYRRGPSNSDPQRFGWQSGGGEIHVQFPTWLMVIVFTVFAAAPWLRPRFSLRTLLIATTLVAIVLGLIVYAARS